MNPVRIYVVALCLAVTGCSGQARVRTTFDRSSPVLFSQRKCIPDEAVVYMQNLALMRSHLRLGAVKHLELALPPRIIVESLQLRIGHRQIAEFNVKQAHNTKLGRYTQVRIRNVDRYLKPGQPLLVEYLTWGIYWSAQYRVDVLPEGQLRLQLGALIQNHWYDLSAMKVTLVAGWVGVSPVHRRGSITPPGGRAGELLAKVGRRIPGRAVPPVLRGATARHRRRIHTRRHRRVGWRSSRTTQQVRYERTRAFSKSLVTKYRIRRVDNTARKRQSNFQMRFADYYISTQKAAARNRALRNRVDGYSLYRNYRINLKRRHKSYLRMASLIMTSKPYYLWPADRGESVYTVYKIPNRSKILLPAGTAWIYREGVFVGHDLHHWTPVGGHAYLTTTNDGGVAVKKQRVHLGDRGRTQRVKLTVRSIHGKPVTVEIFEANPQWRGEGKLSFSHPPITVQERGRFHRWKLSVPAKGKLTVTMDYVPAPAKRAKPVVRPRGKAPDFPPPGLVDFPRSDALCSSHQAQNHLLHGQDRFLLAQPMDAPQHVP